ncbi:MAG: NAD-dependent epimerase/dehydratase family protein [Patescibacteria group bacterium]|jgi:UDP-glucose 4-epimerase
MRTIVTGGSGFIGSHLVDALIEGGHEVTVIDWAEPGDRKNSRAQYVLKDIRDKDLESIVKNISPEVVFHLAAHIDDRASVNDPVMNADHNVLGSINVFESAKRAGAKKIIFASSCAVYGVQEKVPITEKNTPRPRTPYGISKLTGEKYLDSYTTEHQMVTVALRFANVYGPRQDGSKESGAIAIFTAKLLAHEAPFVNGDGTTTRDYVFVGDVVSALVKAGEGNVSGVFNVGTGKETSTSDLFNLVKDLAKSDVQAVRRPEVRDAVARMSLKNSLLKKTFAWKPKTGLKKGIKQTLLWYSRKNRTASIS